MSHRADVAVLQTAGFTGSLDVREKGFGRIQVARREKTSLASALDVHPVSGGAFRFRAGLCPSSAGRHH